MSWERHSPHVLAMAHIPPRMILSKPRQFFNVTPINQMGITVVDLGDIDEGSEAPRSSSLPPTSVKLFGEFPRENRHRSLPRTTEEKVKRPTSRLTSEESDKNAEETSEAGSDGPGSESDGDSSQGTPDEDSKASLRSPHVSRA
jgi:hypothetical protein